MPSSPRSNNATARSCAAGRSSSVGPAARTRAASSRRRATRRAASGSIRRCRCARRTAAVPTRVFLPVDGRRYQAASRDVMAILRRFTPLVEPISIDEAFLDVTGSAALFGDGPAIARRIKDEYASGGRADRVGRRRDAPSSSPRSPRTCASPTGWSSCRRARRRRFLAPLPIGRLWGVGEKTAVALWRLQRPDDRRPGGAAAGPGRPPVRQARRVAGRPRARDRCRSGPRRRPGQVGRPRAHVRCRHQRPRGHRADAAGDGRGRRRPAAFRRRPGRDGRGQDPRQQLPDHHPATDAARADRPDRARSIAAALELARPEVRGIRVRLLGVTASNLGEREQLGDVRAGRPAPPAGDRGRRCAAAPVRGGDGHPGAAARAGLPAPFERDPRNPLDRRARGVPVDPAEQIEDDPTVVTAKVTRTSTIFRPTTLDIERLFGLVSSSQPNRRSVGRVPRTTRPKRPRKGAITDGIHPSRSGHRSTFGPTGSAVVRVRSRGATSNSRSPVSRRSARRPRPIPSSPARERSSRSITPRARLSLTFQHRSRALDGHRPRRRGPHRRLIGRPTLGAPDLGSACRPGGDPPRSPPRPPIRVGPGRARRYRARPEASTPP